MRAELYNFDIFPKVFLVNEEAHITIKPLGAHAAFSDAVQVSITSLIHGLPHLYPDRNPISTYRVTPDADGCLRFTHVFGE